MFSDFLSLIFPDTCIGCDSPLVKGEKLLCIKCKFSLPETNYHLQKTNDLHKRFAGKVAINRAFAYLTYIKDGLAQKIIYTIKYKGVKEGASLMGELYGQYLLSEANLKQEIDLIVPVPLHKKKLQKRGFNQSEWFAKGLSVTLKIPYSDVLLRTEQKESQTLKDRVSRWSNVKEIYKFKKEGNVKELRILLVDDVITTGATMEICANELLKNGAKEVSIAAIAAA